MSPSKSQKRQDQRQPEEMLDEHEALLPQQRPVDEPELPTDKPTPAITPATPEPSPSDDPRLFANLPATLNKQLHDAKNELKRHEDEYKTAEAEANLWGQFAAKIGDDKSRLKFLDPTRAHWAQRALASRTRVHEIRTDIQGLEVILAMLKPPEPKKEPSAPT